MKYQSVHIAGVEGVVPSTEVTTESIERMLSRLYRRVGVPAGMIEQLTGIRARRFWPEGTMPSDGAAMAAEKVLQSTGFPRDKIGVLASTSVCKDFLEPSVAALAHGKIGLPSRCQNFDVGNACLGFMSGMVIVANMIELGQIEAGLVVAGESSRTVTQATVKRLVAPNANFNDFKDNLATLTLGSAATAMLLVHERHATTERRLLGGISLAATEHSDLCVGTETGMKTDAAKLLREGVKLAGHTWSYTQEELGLCTEEVGQFMLHQVGKANHETLVSSLKLPDERAPRLYPDFGNVGAAGVPLTLTMARDQGRIHHGDHVMLMGIGSGLNCAMMGLQW